MNESPISHVPQAKTAMTILQLLLKIAERHKREYDKNQVQLLEKFIDFEQERSPYHEFLNTWDGNPTGRRLLGRFLFHIRHTAILLH